MRSQTQIDKTEQTQRVSILKWMHW